MNYKVTMFHEMLVYSIQPTSHCAVVGRIIYNKNARYWGQNKVFPFLNEHHACKAYEGVGADTHAFLTSTLNGQIRSPTHFSRPPITH